MSKYLIIAYTLFVIGVLLGTVNLFMVNMKVQVVGSFVNGLSGIMLIYEQQRKNK